MDKGDITYFNPESEWSIVQRGLPHWSQAGCVCFVTWRLIDSLPQSVLKLLDAEIETILNSEKLDPHGDWKAELSRRSAKQRGQFQWKLFATRDKYLDTARGACHLAKPGSAQEVIVSLKHFDTKRYFLTDAVVMPNHAHFLVAFTDEETFLKQCTEWKRFTGCSINKLLGQSGKFWQPDQFDHLIRSPDQFDHYRRYIANNPIQAGLNIDQYLHFQKPLT